jgi:hypothetical protein
MEHPLSFARVISRRHRVAQAGFRALAGCQPACIEVRRESREGKAPMGRFRKLFRREPTRQQLYLQLARGLNIERDYQRWIETWVDYGPTRDSTEAMPLSILLVGAPSDADRAHWDGQGPVYAEARRAPHGSARGERPSPDRASLIGWRQARCIA